jgi:hypothetical protein
MLNYLLWCAFVYITPGIFCYVVLVLATKKGRFEKAIVETAAENGWGYNFTHVFVFTNCLLSWPRIAYRSYMGMLK